MPGYYRTRKSAYERVMSRTKIPDNKSDCWLWCGPVNNAGYGMIRGNDGYPKMTTVHRIVGIHKGLNHRKEIQHTCLVKHCVNPDHLVTGTAKSRSERIIKKHGKHFNKPKISHKVCKHCGTKTHIVWFSRMHKDCYPGMKNKMYNNILHKKSINNTKSEV